LRMHQMDWLILGCLVTLLAGGIALRVF
jgi:hypothetical protein